MHRGTSLTALVLVAVVSTMASAAAGKLYRIVRPPTYYDSWRQKRQSHPLATQVRIPEVAFADTVSLTTDGGGGDLGVVQQPPSLVHQGSELAQQGPGLVQQGPSVVQGPSLVQEPAPGGLADYLTPPPPDTELRPAQQPEGKWDLGFDANEILVPPAEQATGYETLKLFTLVPSSPVSLEADPGFENAIQSVLEAGDSSAAGSGSREVVLAGRQQARPPQTGPVYTYVKTDRHGHFKWGVRHGQ